MATMTDAQIRREEDEHRRVRATAGYDEWWDALCTLREAASPRDPDPPRFAVVTLAALMTPAGMARAEAHDAEERARQTIRYSAECAAIEQEERDGALRYRLACYDISPIIERCGGWAITTYGIEKLYDYYPIERYRITDEDDWIDHLGGKRDVPPQSLADFATLHAIVRALDTKGAS